MSKQYYTKIASNTFTAIKPYQQFAKIDPDWRDGMISGNGEHGVVCSGAPYSDVLIYQNMYFIIPSKQPRIVPAEVTKELHEARQAVINFDDTWNVHDRKRTYLYSFHPGHQIRLDIPEEKILNYSRETDYETAEINVKYTDKNGTWTRSTFTSREDNVTITKITKSDTEVKITINISIDDASSLKNFNHSVFGGKENHPEKDMQYKKLVDESCSVIGMVAHYPCYEGSELSEGGYAGVTRVICVGGEKKRIDGPDTKEGINVGNTKNPVISITDADEVYLITKTARTHHMGKLSEFAAMTEYEIIKVLQSDTKKVAVKYLGESGRFSYAKALAPHAEKHSAMYHAVSFCLGSEEYKDDFNEELLKRQKNSKDLLDALVERAYNQGRYAMICCSGFSAPRLCGLWTGEWNPGWNGAYTMDANVNIQVSGMNTGHIYDAAVGYIYFILRQQSDWEENAAMVYGMKDAILVPVNTDGDRAVMVEYDQYYPFQYWNAGASWMLLPIYEFWQCYGNQKIPVNDKISHIYNQEMLDLLKDVLYPLARKQANYWEQLCTPEYYTDRSGKACYSKGKVELSEGEKYIILPSYSPENKPNGYGSTITANAAMDISAARDGLKMIIELEKTLAYKDYEKAVEKWENLMERLPEYKYDESGALCEWAMQEYEENNEHRHISHLYCAWPAYEAQNDDKLTTACNIAIANRNRENVGKDDTASHGWVHKALVAARLKNGESAYKLLYTLMSSDIYFTSLMTDHNTDRSIGVYCTDTSFGTVGIINEMLLYSNTGEIELLPALPTQWKKGFINGLITRTNAQITKLEWDSEKGEAECTIYSNINQKIKIGCRAWNGLIRTAEGKVYSNGDGIELEKDEEIIIYFMR